jgi:hypothetical protein
MPEFITIRVEFLPKNNWQDAFQYILSFMFDYSTKNVGECEINI